MRIRSRFLRSFSATCLCVSLGGLVVAQGPPHKNPQQGTDPADGTNGIVLTTPNNPAGTGNSVSNGEMVVGNPMLSNALDQAFIQRIAMAGMTQMALGKLAIEKASNPSVKQFAERVVEQQTKATNEIKRLAGKESITIPASIDPKRQDYINQIAKLSGDDFDRAFIQAELRGHERALRDFQTEAHDGQDNNLRKYASKHLDTIQEHLTTVRNLNKTVVTAKK